MTGDGPVTVHPVISPFALADLDAALDAWYRASLVAHPFLTETFLVEERQRLAEEWLPNADTTVGELAGAVVGFLSLVDNEVGGLFVHPDHHGRGVGRALMDHARSRRPYLELDVFEDNTIGRRFYDAYGFRPIGRHLNEEVGHHELRLRLDP